MKIKDIIAEGNWKNPNPHAKNQSAYIAIGRPERDQTQKDEEWKCPIYIEHWTKEVTEVRGIGSLDALMNAMNLLQQFLSQHHYIESIN